MGSANHRKTLLPGLGQGGLEPGRLGAVVVHTVQNNQSSSACRIILVIITSLIISRLRIIHPGRLCDFPSFHGRTLCIGTDKESYIGVALLGIIRLVGLGPDQMSFPAIVIADSVEHTPAPGDCFEDIFIVEIAYHPVSGVDCVIELVAVHVFHYPLKMQLRAVQVGEMQQPQRPELFGL